MREKASAAQEVEDLKRRLASQARMAEGKNSDEEIELRKEIERLQEENEKHFKDSVPYKQMQGLMGKKNDQIKELK